MIDLQERRQIHYTDLWGIGICDEAEWIDFKNGICYYGDVYGNVFRVDYELD